MRKFNGMFDLNHNLGQRHLLNIFVKILEISKSTKYLVSIQCHQNKFKIQTEYMLPILRGSILNSTIIFFKKEKNQKIREFNCKFHNKM